LLCLIDGILGMAAEQGGTSIRSGEAGSR